MLNRIFTITLRLLFCGLLSVSINTALFAETVTKKAFDFVVGIDGDFKAAMAAASKSASNSNRFYLFFPNGEYNIGKLTGDANGVTTFPTSNVSFIGENADSTVIFNQSINEGISITSTLFFNNANNLYLQDLTILNKANYRNGSDLSKTGRHVAVKEQGNKIIYKNVKLLSTQDTYYTLGTRTYWENGEIHGTVDFICGQGDIFFNQCLLYLERTSGCLTAPSTKSTWGYVFMNCTIDGPDNNYRLGRAWSNTPKCVFINTTMKKQPAAAGWGDPMNVVPSKFAEYNSKTATGASVDLISRRTTYSLNGSSVKLNPVLTASEASEHTIANVLNGTDKWQPDLLTRQIKAPVVRFDGTALKWDNNDSALCWVVFKDKKFFKCVTTNSCTITPDAKVSYTVRAANAMGGLGSVSNAVQAVATSLVFTTENTHVKIFLSFNSARKTLCILSSIEKINKVVLFSLDGKMVFSKELSLNSDKANIEVPINNLKCGVYLFRIEYSGSLKTGTIRL
jgi:pectin methylesterase-like acyl-CoA thioesterase